MSDICEYCKSKIDKDCYICPICKQSINTYRMKFDNPVMRKLCIFAILFCAFLSVPKLITEKYFFNIITFKGAQVHQLKIVTHKIIKNKDGVVIQGIINNNGTEIFSSIEIEAHLFDKDKNLIEIEKGYVLGEIKPGDNRSFEISRCCNRDGVDIGLSAFSSYELKIVNGFFHKK